MRKLILLFNAILYLNTLFAQGDTISYTEDQQKHNWHYLGTGETTQPLRRMTVKYDVAVIGGGMSGIAAAVAAARQGVDVLLINDRSVLGGNASSEIRVTVNGPHFERTTGIVEEILIANKKYNPQESYEAWDHVLYNYVVKEPNLTLMLNTSAMRAETKRDKIEKVICWQMNTETEVTIEAPIFIDCTGDGVVGAAAGAEYRTGREARAEFDEKYAPEKEDGWVMGESIMMITRDMGRKMPFYAPSYAKKYVPGKGGHRAIKELKEGFWWVELGSNYDIIADRQMNNHDLLAYFYGVWDYIKNSGEFKNVDNLALEWVGSLPGKRESRRLMGDYILSSTDMLENKKFDDAIAWGGWSLDEHCPGGILNLDEPASYFHARFNAPYQIPYRSIYSKNIDNLLFAGRNVSVSHIALSSTRIIETCTAMAQAAGVAAAMCVEYDTTPREIYLDHLNELQEKCLREDYYIPYRKALDEDNLVKDAVITASSTKSGDVVNLVDGLARDEGGVNSHWMSRGTEATLMLEWENKVDISSVEFKFDTNLYRHIMMHKNPAKNADQEPGVPKELVRSLTIEAKIDGQWEQVAEVKDNITRYLPVRFNTISTDELRINLHDTYGANDIKLFELGCY